MPSLKLAAAAPGNLLPFCPVKPLGVCENESGWWRSCQKELQTSKNVLRITWIGLLKTQWVLWKAINGAGYHNDATKKTNQSRKLTSGAIICTLVEPAGNTNREKNGEISPLVYRNAGTLHHPCFDVSTSPLTPLLDVLNSLYIPSFISWVRDKKSVHPRS